VGEEMVMLIVVLLLFTAKPVVVQLAAFKLPFCCKTKPFEAEGHEIVTLLPECVMLNVGAAVVCTTKIGLQNPTVTEKLPPLIAPPEAEVARFRTALGVLMAPLPR